MPHSFYKHYAVVILEAVCFFLVAGCGNEHHENSPWQLVDVRTDSSLIQPSPDTLYDFHLFYCFSGTGVNFGSMQPYFEIKDSSFVYSSRKTSSIKDEPLPPADTLKQGMIRRSSIDSIIDIVSNAEEKKATRLNFSVPEGGLVSISVKTSEIDFDYSFQNCSDATMKAIVAILNTYLDGEELILFDYACEDDLLKMAEDFKNQQK